MSFTTGKGLPIPSKRSCHDFVADVATDDEDADIFECKARRGSNPSTVYETLVVGIESGKLGSGATLLRVSSNDNEMRKASTTDCRRILASSKMKWV